jgi:hypothetical protein
MCYFTGYRIRTGLGRSTIIFIVCKWLAYYPIPADNILNLEKKCMCVNFKCKKSEVTFFKKIVIMCYIYYNYQIVIQ